MRLASIMPLPALSSEARHSSPKPPQAEPTNTATAAKLDGTEEAIDKTDSRLTDLDGQNEAARAQIAAVAQGPAQLHAGANNADAQAQAILAGSDDLEIQLHAAQEEFASEMATVPGSAALARVSEESAMDTLPPFIKRAMHPPPTATASRSMCFPPLRDPPTAAAIQEQQERAARAAERRRTRLREINDRADGHFEKLSAIDKMGIALDITAENLMGDLGGAKWPNLLGQMALALVDPAVSLEGVVSGLNMVVSGAANLFSAQQWKSDPLGNLLKSAADIATGLTIILGSIAGFCTAILVILGALAILTFGAMGPLFAAASAFLGPVITTVGGWAISCAAIAAELQFYVLIKNLIDAAAASTADELEHESDQMTEDATQAANMAAQVAVAGVMEAGGSALADTAVGQRLGAAATSVGETFDMIPPPRGTPVLEPGAATIPESPVAPLEGGPAPLEARGPAAPEAPSPVIEPPSPAEAPPAPAAPTAAPAAPTVEPAAPTVEPVTPTAAPAAPTAAAPAPTVEPTAPTAEPAAPTVEPTAPTVEPTAPTAAPAAPTVEPTAPTAAPAAPTVEPTAPTAAPAAPTVEPTAPTVEPTAPTAAPAAPTVEPTAPTVEPTAPTAAPAAPTAAPAAPTVEPTSPTVEPAAAAAREAPTPGPEGAAAAPEASNARAQVEQHLKRMRENGISPQELGFNSREWEQFQRDYATNPERALATLEEKFGIHGHPPRGTIPSEETTAGELEALADDVREQAHPRPSESTSAPERARAALEAAEMGRPQEMYTDHGARTWAATGKTVGSVRRPRRARTACR